MLSWIAAKWWRSWWISLIPLPSCLEWKYAWISGSYRTALKGKFRTYFLDSKPAGKNKSSVTRNYKLHTAFSFSSYIQIFFEGLLRPFNASSNYTSNLKKNLLIFLINRINKH